MSLRNMVLFSCAMAVIILWTIIGINYLYVQYRPLKIIEHHFTEAEVLNKNKEVKRGEFLLINYKFSKYMDIAGVISRMLVNDRGVPLTNSECALLQVGKNQTKVLRVFIPENMFPGKYYLVTSIRYPITSDRAETVSYRTEWFEVLP